MEPPGRVRAVRSGLGALLVAAALVGMAGAGPVAGQGGSGPVATGTPGEPGGDGEAAAGEAGTGGGFSLLGRPAPGARLIGGLWTLHPFAISWPRVEETFGYGILWRGFFGATFVNSYGDRAFTAGVEREWFRLRAGPVGVGAGYRAGLVTGYDERLLSWADDVPALPLLGLQAFATVGPLRMDAFYIYRVITLEASVESWWEDR